MYNTYSTQGWLYIILSLILTIICMSLNIYIQGAGLYLILYVLFIIMILITAYNITCLTKGECYAWSWLVSLMSLIPMIIVTIMLILFSLNKQ
jgi:hypothetical protein